MKKLISVILFLTFIISPSFSEKSPAPPPPRQQQREQRETHRIEDLIVKFYGYEVDVDFMFDAKGEYIFVKTEDNDYNDYEHITFMITFVRALFKYSELYHFNFRRFTKIEMITGKVKSTLSRFYFNLALSLGTQREIEEFLLKLNNVKE